MAILARVSNHGITDGLDLMVTVQFFDDNDPANSGVGGGGEPGNTLLVYSWTYPATLNGSQLRDALQADILARGAKFVRARNASADAKTWVPIKSLLAVG